MLVSWLVQTEASELNKFCSRWTCVLRVIDIKVTKISVKYTSLSLPLSFSPDPCAPLCEYYPLMSVFNSVWQCATSPDCDVIRSAPCWFTAGSTPSTFPTITVFTGHRWFTQQIAQTVSVSFALSDKIRGEIGSPCLLLSSARRQPLHSKFWIPQQCNQFNMNSEDCPKTIVPDWVRHRYNNRITTDGRTHVPGTMTSVERCRGVRQQTPSDTELDWYEHHIQRRPSVTPASCRRASNESPAPAVQAHTFTTDSLYQVLVPPELRQPELSYGQFRRSLKTFLFGQ